MAIQPAQAHQAHAGDLGAAAQHLLGAGHLALHAVAADQTGPRMCISCPAP